MNKTILDLIKNAVSDQGKRVKTLINTNIAEKTISALKWKKQLIASEGFGVKKKISESVIAEIKKAINSTEPVKVTLDNQEVVDVDSASANAIITVLNSLEPENKNRMEALVGNNLESFLKVLNFSVEQLKTL